MAKAKYSDREWNAILARCERGETTGVLLREFSITEPTLRRQRGKRGIAATHRRPLLWSERDVFTVLSRIKRKQTYSQIAAKLNVTRCAVAGMVHRLRESGALV